MLVPPLDVSHLHVVGYAEALSRNALPSIVPPVFREVDNAGSFLVPPYSFNGPYVCDATRISHSELHSLAHRQEVTLLPAAFSARTDYELWIDQAGEPHYQHRREAREHLRRIAEREVVLALQAFSQCRLDDAESHSSVALLAEEQNLDAMAVKIAISHMRADFASTAILRELLPQHALAAVDARASALCADLHSSGKPLPTNPPPPLG